MKILMKYHNIFLENWKFVAKLPSAEVVNGVLRVKKSSFRIIYDYKLQIYTVLLCKHPFEI